MMRRRRHGCGRACADTGDGLSGTLEKQPDAFGWQCEWRGKERLTEHAMAGYPAAVGKEQPARLPVRGTH